jgi:hypothetical protein
MPQMRPHQTEVMKRTLPSIKTGAFQFGGKNVGKYAKK